MKRSLFSHILKPGIYVFQFGNVDLKVAARSGFIRCAFLWSVGILAMGGCLPDQIYKVKAEQAGFVFPKRLLQSDPFRRPF